MSVCVAGLDTEEKTNKETLWFVGCFHVGCVMIYVLCVERKSSDFLWVYVESFNGSVGTVFTGGFVRVKKECHSQFICN